MGIRCCTRRVSARAAGDGGPAAGIPASLPPRRQQPRRDVPPIGEAQGAHAEGLNHLPPGQEGPLVQHPDAHVLLAVHALQIGAAVALGVLGGPGTGKNGLQLLPLQLQPPGAVVPNGGGGVQQDGEAARGRPRSGFRGRRSAAGSACPRTPTGRRSHSRRKPCRSRRGPPPPGRAACPPPGRPGACARTRREAAAAPVSAPACPA